MADSSNAPEPSKAAMAPGPEPAWQASCLLRAARAGMLATQKDGQPFASLVTPACAPDGSVLMFLSQLSEHTRQLKAEPRCSLMVMGEAGSANPQTAPRVTLSGTAAIETDPVLKARWLAVHPYAQLYAEFADFALWRLRPATAQLVGGFARAFRLKPSELAADPAVQAALLAAEAEIIAHCNADHADAMALLAGAPGRWQMVALDADGFDLAEETPDGSPARVIRRAWSASVDSSAAVRKELITMTRAAREEM